VFRPIQVHIYYIESERYASCWCPV
jgi:hypothetical protein